MYDWALLIPCLGGGVVFAALAVWLSTKKGNTISEILDSQKFNDAEAIKVEILDRFKLSSNLPIVALYIVSAFVAVGLPAFVSWQQRINQIESLKNHISSLEEEVARLKVGTLLEKPITVTGQIKVSPPSADLSKELKFSSVPPAAPDIFPSGSYSFQVEHAKEIINLTSGKYQPLTIFLDVDEKANSIDVTYSYGGAKEIPLKNRTAKLEPISLTPIEVKK
jgi:hypothetical protein